jgi:protein SCO1/2
MLQARMSTRRAWLRGTAWRVGALIGASLGPVAWSFAAEALKVLRPPVKTLPPIALIGMNGQAGKLDTELASDVPLLLNFVFTTCSSSCSVQTALLAQVQRTLVGKGRPLQLASITIDPDNDTPAQLRKFAGHFGIAAGWQFYTGRFDDLLQVQRHFDVYRGSKSAHPPVLFMRKSARAPWLRVEGFPGAAELLVLIDSLPDAPSAASS